MKSRIRLLVPMVLAASLLGACSVTPDRPQRPPASQENPQLAPPNPVKEHRRQRIDGALEGVTIEGDRLVVARRAPEPGVDLRAITTEARRLAEVGYTIEAMALFVDVLRGSTDATANSEIYFGLAKQLEREKRVETAIAALRSGLDLDVQNPDARLHLGGLLQAVGDREKAMEELRYLVRFAPGNRRAHAQLAVLSYQTGDLASARDHADAAGVEVPAQLPALLDGTALGSAKSAGPSSLGSGVGPQIRIDNGTGQLNESSASSSASRPLEVVSAWHSYDDPGTIRVAAGVSLDGGVTWGQQLIRPLVPFRKDVEGDPMTAVDPRTGNSWTGGIAFDSPLPGQTSQSHLFVARRLPGATSHGSTVMIRTATNLDKAFLAVGQRPGLPTTTRLYVAYTLLNPFQGQLQLSDNLGATWSSVRTLPEMGTGLHPRVGPNGELYILYWDGNLSFPSRIRLARSFDGGTTFEKVVNVADRLDWWNVNITNRLPGNFRTPPLPYLAVDPSSGHLYAVYFDTTNIVGTNRNVDLYFTRSTNQGASWSPPVPILSAAPPADQFFPWIEVDSQGRLHLLFWDTRNVTQNDGSGTPTAWLDVYYAVSFDQGTTWTESRLTPSSFNAALGVDFGSGRRFLGDYSSLAVGDDVAHPVYLSTQNGDGDLFTHRVEPVLPPDARDDYYATFHAQSLAIFFDDLLINDRSLSRGTLSICGNTAPNLGTLIPFPGGGTYTPPTGFVGADSIGFTVCDSNGGSTDTALSIEVLPGAVGFFDDFETGIGKEWTAAVNQGSYIIASTNAALQGNQGLEAGVAGVAARAFVFADGKQVDNHHAIFQLDPSGMNLANGDIHTVFRGLDNSGQGLFEVQVDRPSAFGPHRIRGRLRASSGAWVQTAWTTVDRPVAVNVDWNAGPSLPFQVASLRLKIDGLVLPTLTATNPNPVDEIRLGVNDVIDPQTQGIHRFDSFYASSVYLQ